MAEIHRLNDNSDRLDPAARQLQQLDPDLPDFCCQIIHGYTPKKPTSGVAWETVRPAVIEWVVAMKPRTHSNARRLMMMTGLYVAWVWTVTGTDLVPSRVFTNSLILRYLADRLANHSEPYRFDTARQLATIGGLLTSNDISRLPTPPQPRRAKPYTDAEIAKLYSWSRSLTTEFKRERAKAFLGLAGGAGLSAQELMTIRVEDVIITGRRALVHVRDSDQPRTVPVRASWVRTLSESIGTRTTGYMFQAYRLLEYPPHELQRFLSDNPCTPRPSASRLHSGWIVSLLDASIPLPLLLQIAGLTSVQSLQPYLTFTEPHDLDDHIGRITGEEVA